MEDRSSQEHSLFVSLTPTDIARLPDGPVRLDNGKLLLAGLKRLNVRLELCMQDPYDDLQQVSLSQQCIPEWGMEHLPNQVGSCFGAGWECAARAPCHVEHGMYTHNVPTSHSVCQCSLHWMLPCLHNAYALQCGKQCCCAYSY